MEVGSSTLPPRLMYRMLVEVSRVRGTVASACRVWGRCSDAGPAGVVGLVVPCRLMASATAPARKCAVRLGLPPVVEEGGGPDEPKSDT